MSKREMATMNRQRSTLGHGRTATSSARHSSLFTNHSLTTHLLTARGQALIELALFGSIMLLVLAYVVNYGLTADSTQQMAMSSFRQAMKTTADSQLDGTPTSGSHAIQTERHIPDPREPLAIGAFLPASGGGASAVRSFKLPLAAENEQELSRTYFTFQGSAINCPKTGSGCLAAGFRDEGSLPGFVEKDGKWVNEPNDIGPLDRYQEIYGAANVLDQGPGGCPSCRNVRIIDSCEGEILSYEGCYRQAVQINDPEVCARECFRGRLPGSTLDCNAICAQPVSIPWYAQGGFKDGRGIWVFPALDHFFAGLQALGPQSDYVKQRTLDLNLNQGQTPAGLQTDSTIERWFDQTTREFIYRPYNDTTGTPARQPLTTTQKDVQSQTTTWTTPWN